MVETQRLPDSVAECLVVWDLCHEIYTTTAATVTKTRTLVTTAKPEGHTVAGKADTTTGDGLMGILRTAPMALATLAEARAMHHHQLQHHLHAFG